MKTPYLLLLTILALHAHTPAHAWSDKTWDDISAVGVYSLVGTALILPTTRKDWEGLRQAAYSMGSATGISLIGKALVDEERPDNSDDDSFPSGHTMHAVGFSWILMTYYPELGLFVLPFTILVAMSRLVLGLHYPSDVLAGALIGSTIANIVIMY